MKVAIQGVAGSYSHLAVTRLYPEFELVECKWFDDLFNALDKGDTDIAICPVENSVAGTIIETYDLINKHAEITVTGEIYLRVEHQLITKPNTQIADVQRVFSHPMAIRQCTQFLEAHEWQIIESTDTAASVRAVIEGSEHGDAAIGSSLAAEIYGGTILAGGIENDKENFTRFWVLEKRKPTIDLPGCNKVSLQFEAKHEPGSLARILNIFASAGIDLTKIESRPILGKKWIYNFYCDLYSPEGADMILQAAKLAALNSVAWRTLGVYKQALVV